MLPALKDDIETKLLLTQAPKRVSIMTGRSIERLDWFRFFAICTTGMVMVLVTPTSRSGILTNYYSPQSTWLVRSKLNKNGTDMPIDPQEAELICTSVGERIQVATMSRMRAHGSRSNTRSV